MKFLFVLVQLRAAVLYVIKREAKCTADCAALAAVLFTNLIANRPICS